MCIVSVFISLESLSLSIWFSVLMDLLPVSCFCTCIYFSVIKTFVIPMMKLQTHINREMSWSCVVYQQNRTGAGPTSLPQVQSQLAPPTADADSFRSPVDKVPYPVQEYCGLCWTNGTKSLQQGTTNRCVKGHSNFNIKRVGGCVFRFL